MIIKTENFKRFSKIIEMFDKKGNRMEESIYLNFKDSVMYFGNGAYSSTTEGVMGQLRFEYELEGESITDFKNVFVNTRLFLTLAKQYEELHLSKDYEFYNGEEKFKINYFFENFDYPEFNREDFDTFTLSRTILDNLKTSQIYMGVDDLSENYFGVQLIEDSIVSTDGAAIFQAKNDNIIFPEIQISGMVLKVILAGSEDNKCSMYYNNDTDDLYFCFGEDEVLTIASTQIDNLRVPPIKDPNFIEKYDHDTFIVVEKVEILEILSFFEIFVKDVRNEQLYISIIDNETASIESKSENKGNRLITLKECSKALNNVGFWFARAYLAKAINSIKDDFIKLKIDITKPAFNVIGETQEERSVAIVMLSED